MTITVQLTSLITLSDKTLWFINRTDTCHIELKDFPKDTYLCRLDHDIRVFFFRSPFIKPYEIYFINNHKQEPFLM